MPPDSCLHERPDFPELIRIVAGERGLLPALVEKDYWIMHCLYGLNAQGLSFELKGGTSLSKGFGIIQRFSEDIDIRIDPACAPFEVFVAPNQTKKARHIESRKRFYDWLADTIQIAGIVDIDRDHAFDDEKYRSGGIRLHYVTAFDNPADLKEGILLEVGFDDTLPNMPRTISSWAFDRALETDIAITDNRAVGVPCYHPGYTFVEKLQTVSTKFRQQQNNGEMPPNFLRHYYDIGQLLEHPDVNAFVGTPEYRERKERRFRKGDNLIIAENEAFLLSNPETRKQYTLAYQATASLYFGEQIPFDAILENIQRRIAEL
ncbi:MAG: nucleotidyl transferase AbiEii/AbiGii toxin family protein [Candidatus Thiodiazotropha sp. (ex Ctena orbiculata)]|nr:nucleotidyl transferase AbiEii/AbiGii toxin family protein [Candidatus Thiodiazotropha taylori]